MELLGPHGRELGIDHIICNLQPWASGRGQPRIFAAAYPHGKLYTGTHPHKDHAHVGLTRAAATNLTLTTIRRVVGTPAPPPPEPEPVPLPPSEEPLLPITSKSTQQDIGRLQDLINETYYAPKGEDGLTLDGIYGNGTAAAVRKWLLRYTNDTDPEVQAGRKVNFNQFNALMRDWILVITR